MTGAFIPAGSLTEGRVLHSATSLPDGRVLVMGGLGGDYFVLASAEVWDPVTAAFVPAGSLREGRRNPTAVLLPDGRVFVVGGEGDSDYIGSAEVWVPSAG